MRGSDVVNLYTALESIGVILWIDGGWGVDALLGRQTREHDDLDIALDERHVQALRSFLTDAGYRDVPRDDMSRWNFVLGDAEGRQVDVHVFVMDAAGVIIDGLKYPEQSLTGHGVIEGIPVRCIEANHLIRFHSGYPLRAKDHHDVRALCDHFGVQLPSDFEAVS